jgi:hypothetical protein
MHNVGPEQMVLGEDGKPLALGTDPSGAPVYTAPPKKATNKSQAPLSQSTAAGIRADKFKYKGLPPWMQIMVDEALGHTNAPGMGPEGTTSKYNDGDTKVIGGKTYVRKGGVWNESQ